MEDPALAGITGMIEGRLPPMSQAGTDLNVKIDQLKGKAFLDAFESLKGGGAITEREGQSAVEAMGRLNRAQSTEEFQRALGELRSIIQLGVERTRQRAGSAFADPSPGEVMPPPDAQPMAPPAAPVQIGSMAEFDALPPGTTFIAPDGSTRVKP